MKRTTTFTLLVLACLTVMPTIAQGRYRDGMNLYEYVRSKPVSESDPSGKAVVFFGGGFEVPKVNIDTGPLFVPMGFRSAKDEIDAMKGEAAFVRGGLAEDLVKASNWLKNLEKAKKCELRIVGFSTGTAVGLALARDAVKRPEHYGIPDGALKALIFYDFNWGAAGHPTYSRVLGEPANFDKPPGKYAVHHVVSYNLNTQSITLYNLGLSIFGPRGLIIPRGADPMHISDWTEQVWEEIGAEEPTLEQYARYHIYLANTSGSSTAKRTGQDWLEPTEEWSKYDHLMMGAVGLLIPDDPLSKLFPDRYGRPSTASKLNTMTSKDFSRLEATIKGDIELSDDDMMELVLPGTD